RPTTMADFGLSQDAAKVHPPLPGHTSMKKQPSLSLHPAGPSPLCRRPRAFDELSSQPAVHVDVKGLMAHIQELAASGIADSHAAQPVPNPLWTALAMDWAEIYRHVLSAERAGSLDGALTRLPTFSGLTRFLRYLGFRLVLPVIRLPCLLAVRVLLPLIYDVARQQQQVNQALIGCGRGVAQRLMDCEIGLERQAEHFAALESHFADKLKAQAEMIRSLQAELSRYRRAA